ncbi:tyrosine-type recombinase/integrase, partial [Iamia sp.]|uniref:tyrosine-type recombinase/integrase n=1 Tax=Iamia sp. TaxID=2722710 RepID=UPI002C211BD5
DLTPLVRSFERSLRARKRSPKTITAYTDAAALFIAHQAEGDRALVAAEVTRGNVEDFIIDQLGLWSPSTAATRYRCLAQFWRFVVEEGEVDVSPMVNMSPPTIPESTVPVIPTDDLRRLLKVCEGPGFENRRDLALIRLFIATGVRLGEMSGLRVGDVNLDGNAVLVVGKGQRSRWVPFGDRAALALDRYDRERRRHPREGSGWWWLSPRGHLTDSGIAQVLRRRARAAGVPDLHPHRFRHTLAHRWLAAGGTEGDLQELAGWRSAQMVARYGASARSERARSAYRRIDVEGDL